VSKSLFQDALFQCARHRLPVVADVESVVDAKGVWTMPAPSDRHKRCTVSVSDSTGAFESIFQQLMQIGVPVMVFLIAYKRHSTSSSSRISFLSPKAAM
jgi:hypothetical protein